MKNNSGYTITGVKLQKIELDNKPAKDSIYYYIGLTTLRNDKWQIHLWKSARHSDEPVDSIIILDQHGKNMTELATLAGSSIEALLPATKNGYNEMEPIYADTVSNWHDAKEEMGGDRVMGEPGIFIFSVAKNAPIPTYVILKFMDRELKAKVSNKPLHFKAK